MAKEVQERVGAMIEKVVLLFSYCFFNGGEDFPFDQRVELA